MKNNSFIPDLPNLANQNNDQEDKPNLIEDEVSADLSDIIKNIEEKNEKIEQNKRIENTIANIANKKVIVDKLPKLQEKKEEKPEIKISKKGLVLMIVAAMLGIFISVFLVFTVLRITDNTKESNIKKESTIKTNSINYKNYQFTIPEKYEAKSIDDGVEFINENDDVDIVIDVENNFQLTDIIQIKNTLRQQFKNLGYTINNVVQKTYENRSFLIFESTKDNETIYYSFADIGSSDIARIGLYTKGIIDDEEVYKTISQIISTASMSKTDNKNQDTDVSVSAKEFTFKLK